MIVAFYPGGGGNRYLQRMRGKDWQQPNTSYDRQNHEQAFVYRYLLAHDVEVVQQQDVILTHCMHTPKLKHLWPGSQIIVLKTDLKHSLQREWVLHGHKRFIDNISESTNSRLEHYRAVRDQSWPVANTLQDLDQLPEQIKHEVAQDYDSVQNKIKTVPKSLESITKDFLDKINSSYEIISWHLDYYSSWPTDFSLADQVVDVHRGQDDFCMVMQTELARYSSEVFDQVWTVLAND